MATYPRRSSSFPFFGGASRSRFSRKGPGRSSSSPRGSFLSAGSPGSPSAYRAACSNFTGKIASFKTLCAQTSGPAKFGRPSPATLNSFANWINKGAVVQTVSPTQMNRWCSNMSRKFNCNTSSGCKALLSNKFGKSCIKAVARAKNGAWMVATSPTRNGKPFKFPG